MGDSTSSSVGFGVRDKPVRVIKRRHGSIEEMVVLCDCDTMAISPLRSSTRERSRGRRFYGCKNYKQGGCGFFIWEDEVGENIRIFNETCCVCQGRRGDDDNNNAKMWKEIKNTKISLRIMWCALAVNLFMSLVFGLY